MVLQICILKKVKNIIKILNTAKSARTILSDVITRAFVNEITNTGSFNMLDELFCVVDTTVLIRQMI